jgi:anaerobic dimethyl sulfoxide reductase subunit B (iron-sulfur subunit)
MTYAFSFDARYCSGCKACQAACKDKNNLPVGVLWRRVFEVCGGSWQQEGDVWTNNVFAYNMSISCNHCLHPKCAGVCPTNAYVLREDGIVFLDTTKCVGCGYCAWACPYSAPQYNADAGHMSKCDFCYDYLEQGLPPACAAACPMRTLDYGQMETSTKGTPLWDTPPASHPYPLPIFSRTQPRLAITPHPAMNLPEKKSVSNVEEIEPRLRSAWSELPLIVFTLFTQLAVGGFWTMSMLSWLLIDSDTTWLRWLPSLLIGASLGIGMLASFAHLGTKKNAWRVLQNFRKSSLSREILFTGLFGVSWLFTTIENAIRHRNSFEWTATTAVLGIGLIHNMSQVYRFPAARSWNTWRTNAGFLLSALLLGISSMTSLLAFEANLSGIQIPSAAWTWLGGSTALLLAAQWAVTRKPSAHNPLHAARTALMGSGILVSVLTSIPNFHGLWIMALLFLLVATEEAIGRWSFYEAQPSIAKQCGL